MWVSPLFVFFGLLAGVELLLERRTHETPTQRREKWQAFLAFAVLMGMFALVNHACSLLW